MAKKTVEQALKRAIENAGLPVFCWKDGCWHVRSPRPFAVHCEQHRTR